MNPRPCPACGEIFEPRKVGGTWTKSCSEPCRRELIARAMRAGGAKRASAASARIRAVERVPVVCATCGTTIKLTPGAAKGRKTCSIACRVKYMRAQGGAERRGVKNPNWRGGRRAGERDRDGERRWYAAGANACQMCNQPRDLHLHHVVYRQEVQRAKGDVWSPENAMTLCASCHSSHHRRGRVIPVAVLADANFDYAAGLLGFGPAYEYLRRRYRGEDARLDALLMGDIALRAFRTQWALERKVDAA